MRSLDFPNVKFSHLEIKFIRVFSLVRGRIPEAGTCSLGHPWVDSSAISGPIGS